jgi:hypothetical protein
VRRLWELGRHERVREWLIGGAQLAALWAFAFVQPLLDLLGRNPDFWVARGNTAGDLIVFSIGFTILPPLLLMALEGVAAIADRRAYRVLHLGLVALLVAVVAVQVEKRIFSGPAGVMIAVALVVGAGIAYLLWRGGFVQQLLNLLGISPVVFLVIFLFFSDSSELVLPQAEAGSLGVEVPSRTPVVLVVFDEFPTATLMNERGRIDADRFPNFARLAAQSNWYPNNTTVADYTPRAVPAIYTGIAGGYTSLPIAGDHPDSLFTLLGGAYRMHSEEAVTHICPESVCGNVLRPEQLTRLKSLVEDLRYVEGRLILPPALANRLPNVSTTFGNFGNNDSGKVGQFAQDLFQPPTPREFENWLVGIRGPGPTLHQIHIELPHDPFQYLPTGQTYEDTSIDQLATDDARFWVAGADGIATSLQRHYLQTGYADHLVGLLINRLKRAGIWKKALVIVTADHGISFEPGTFRRTAVRNNVGGVANPPLLIRFPGQRNGRISLAHTRTVDIVPTIAKQLGIRLPYKTNGVPVSEEQPGGRVVLQSGSRQILDVPLSSVLRERRAALRRTAAWLGANTGIYALGPRSDLLGATGPPVSGAGAVGTATVENGDDYADVDPTAEQIPAFVVGELDRVVPGSVIAIGVNSRIVATCRAFENEGAVKYGAVVPPSSLLAGKNRISIYLVPSGGTLLPLGGT